MVLYRFKLLAFAWLFIISFLFFLPGSALPKQNWFAAMHLDKWVHVGLFAILSLLCCAGFGNNAYRRLALIFVVTVLYGLLVEIIQGAWVPNRSFDLFDLLADAGGSFFGIAVWGWGKKNKPL